MQNDVVCNASPLIFLAKIGMLKLLNPYAVHIPSQVESEILKGVLRKKADATLIVKYLKGRKIVSVKTNIIKALPDFLGSGEKAVISPAVKRKTEKVFIDEAKARAVARLYGLYPRGTLGILWNSYKMGNIDKTRLETLLFELLEKGYRIKEEIFLEFIKKIRDSS